MDKFELKDSGQREKHSSGAVRDIRLGKGRYDLVTPIGLKRVTIINEKGAIKYNDRNWEKGMPICRFLDSAIRHIYQNLEGLRDEDHLAQAAWNLLAAMYTEEMIKRGLMTKKFDDRPNYLSKKK